MREWGVARDRGRLSDVEAEMAPEEHAQVPRRRCLGDVVTLSELTEGTYVMPVDSNGGSSVIQIRFVPGSVQRFRQTVAEIPLSVQSPATSVEDGIQWA